MRANNKGFTLIELIIFIIVGGIFLPVSMIAFTSVMNSYSRPDYYVKAKFFAEKRMAEITNTPYDSITQASFCSTPTDEGDGYTTECSVNTINPIDLSTTSPSPYYKRITVTVKYSGLLSDYVIKTIVTRRPNLP
ncbi:MAG TPA: prepilin-type N-terminal cleavage/methylation domain-containing protein [bacterium]|nr:prepilin-type N-terminal cleavage/methylation domain-containing protein [bacterium]